MQLNLTDSVVRYLVSKKEVDMDFEKLRSNVIHEMEVNSDASYSIADLRQKNPEATQHQIVYCLLDLISNHLISQRIQGKYQWVGAPKGSFAWALMLMRNGTRCYRKSCPNIVYSVDDGKVYHYQVIQGYLEKIRVVEASLSILLAKDYEVWL